MGGVGKLSMPSSGHCSRLSGSLVLMEGGSWSYPEVSWAVPGEEKGGCGVFKVEARFCCISWGVPDTLPQGTSQP